MVRLGKIDKEFNLMNTFVQNNYKNSSEWQSVCEIAEALDTYLQSSDIQEKISLANVPGARSQEIQDIFLVEALRLGFIDESQGLFGDYTNNRLRPDYFLALPNGSGIILEVERGKTNQNNMDFLDFWKCHICTHAHYLFIMVPYELRQNNSGRVVGRPYKTVSDHFSSFFMPKNYTNVRGAVVFGY